MFAVYLVNDSFLLLGCYGEVIATVIFLWVSADSFFWLCQLVRVVPHRLLSRRARCGI